MRDIAYDAYWNRTVNAGFKEVVAAVINEWDGAHWYERMLPDDGDEVRYKVSKIGIILPIERKD
jgi:hypothetical protein